MHIVRSIRIRELVAAVVVAVIAAATVLTGSLGGEALARVERSVQSQWRPTYDLIVVPKDVDLSVDVGPERVLQANFMSSLPNGISIEQWRDIQELPGVDVAAPISNIGYFSRSQSFYRVEDLTPGIYSIRRRVWWDNGVEQRLQGQTMSSDEPSTSNYGCGQTRAPLVIGDHGGNVGELLTLDFLVTGFAGGLTAAVEHPASWQCLGLDPGGVFTVFGIDPHEERRLVGLGDAISEGEQLSPKMGLQRLNYQIERGNGERYDIRDIPLLFAQDEWVRSRMRIDYTRWQTGRHRTGNFMAEASTAQCARRYFRDQSFLWTRGVAKFDDRCWDRALQERLISAPRRHELSVDLPSPGGRSLVRGTYVDGRWKLREESGVEVGRYWVAQASAQSYERATDPPTGDWVGALRAVATGSYGPEPTYREQLPPLSKKFLRYNIVGTYDAGAVAERFGDQGQWLPEGTYQVPEAITRFDAEGNPVDPAQLRPTGNPLGYLVQPPQALTNMKVSSQLVGDTPIAAIRIRLSGVDRAGEESWQQIEDAVRRIRETTGLRVLVTAGSSPTRVLVELPGVTADEQPSGVEAWEAPNVGLFFGVAPPDPARTVEGFGWVEEKWLVEGAAVRYLQATASSHLWLLGVVSAAGLVYLAAAFTSMGLARIPTVAIRRAVGWPRRLVFAGELGRAMSIGLLGALLGVGAGVLGSRLAGLDVEPLLVWLAAPVAIMVCGVAALWPAWRVSGVPLSAALSGAEIAVTSGLGRRRSSNVQRVPAIAVLELWRMRTRTLLALASGTVAVGAIVTLTSVSNQYAGSLQVTLLGQELLVEAGPLQRAGTGVAVVLAVLMVAELLWQAVRDRRRELGMLRAIGWGRRHVVWLMVCQGVLLGALAAVLGAISTAGLLAATLTGAASAVPLVTSTLPWATTIGVLLGALAAGLPALAASRIPPADALRTA